MSIFFKGYQKSVEPVHTGPLWLFMREPALFDASVDDIKHGIDHRSHSQLAVAPTRLGWWDQIFDKIPFGISEVCPVLKGPTWHRLMPKPLMLLRHDKRLDDNSSDAENRLGRAFRGDKFL